MSLGEFHARRTAGRARSVSAGATIPSTRAMPDAAWCPVLQKRWSTFRPWRAAERLVRFKLTAELRRSAGQKHAIPCPVLLQQHLLEQQWVPLEQE